MGMICFGNLCSMFGNRFHNWAKDTPPPNHQGLGEPWEAFLLFVHRQFLLFLVKEYKTCVLRVGGSMLGAVNIFKVVQEYWTWGKPWKGAQKWNHSGVPPVLAQKMTQKSLFEKRRVKRKNDILVWNLQGGLGWYHPLLWLKIDHVSSTRV